MGMLPSVKLPRIDAGPFGFGSAAKREPDNTEFEKDWESWLLTLFPEHVGSGFAEHHADYWRWVWAIEKDLRSRPHVNVWSRGHGKSTNAELGVVALGARRVKRYVLYVSGTQDQADDHVQNIADMLESPGIEKHYPGLSRPKVGKYGNSRGWRRNRLRTAWGLTVDAIGLDSAARGAKVEEDRPDLIIFDDIDSESDSDAVVEKKIRALTRKLIPAGARNLAILAVQNLVHAGSIFSRMVDGRADFLADRVLSGPVPAIRNFEYEERMGRTVVAGGEATWGGMDLTRCQEMIDEMGLEAFLVECQHRTDVMGERPFRAEWWSRQNRYDPNSRTLVNRTIARFVVWDTANKKKKTNAYTVAAVGELLPDYRLVLRHVNRERKSFDELPDHVAEQVYPFTHDLKLRDVLVEDAASGQQLIQVLDASGPEWLRSRIVPVKPHPDGKEALWRSAAPWCRRGMVLLPHPDPSVPWLHDFETEVFDLLAAEFKDQGDAFAMLINHVERTHKALSTGWRVRVARTEAAGA